MAVADMAAQARMDGDNTVSSVSGIAVRQGISSTYLEQLLGKLRKAGLLVSHRGVQGGYGLAKPASEIRLSEVIQAVDETVKAHGCTPDAKKACNGLTDRCLTHNLWGALEVHIEDFFGRISVQDVVDGRIGDAALEGTE